MAPVFFQKPEAALKRAHELIQVGKEQDALETLHDTIKARRHKLWSQMHEQIMLKHLELCVNLKKPHVAKDALFQYKALAQQVAIESLELVIERFLAMAEAKTEEAQKSSIEKVEEIDDLDQADNPENLLLSVVSGAVAQDRMDRTVLSPWLRFLWDSYRNCLELLRNNAQVEQLYHRITRKSFAFCAKFQRRTEFRKLCDLLRLHLVQIQKHQHLAHTVKLTSAESLSLMQETRLCQLDTSIQMELWQEAYRSAEDVHGMMQLSKDKDRRTVKPASYVNYYDKLALVFWKAGNRLFHAAALLQKFVIYKDMKKTFSSEEAMEQASRLLLATLAIPDGADAPSDLTRHLDIEEQHMSNMRLLSNLLRLPIAPTRTQILKECARLGVPDAANQHARSLFRLLENNFAPLRLTKEVVAVLDQIDKPDYEIYLGAIKTVAATKSLKQISVIYDTISWERLLKVLPFFEELELERFLVDVSKHRFVKAQIDHRNGCVRFGGAAEATLAGGVDLEDEGAGFTGDDTQLGVEGIRSHLELMYTKLRATVEHLNGDAIRDDAIENVKRHATVYNHHKNTDYERILGRRRKIETYKETCERVKAEKSAKAAEETARREDAKRLEEKKRLEQENINIEKKKREADKREVEEKIKAEQMRKLLSTSFGMTILREYGEEGIAEMDIEQVLREQRERLDRERQQTQQRLQAQERKFDHWVRALHLEESIQRRLMMDMKLKEAPAAWNDNEAKRIQKAIDAHERDVDLHEKLPAIEDTAFQWIEKVKCDHEHDFNKKMHEWESKLEAVRNARLSERAEGRRKQRRDEWLRKKAEDERRKKEDEERQKQAALDEQRRARRGGDDGPRGRREREFDMDSKAMADDNWRRGGPSSGPPPPRPAHTGFDRGMDRGGDRAPMRERNDGPPSAADSVSDWRGAARVAQPPPPPRAGGRDREMTRDGMMSRGDDMGRPRAPPRPHSPDAPTRDSFGTNIRRDNGPSSSGPRGPPPPSESEGKWERKPAAAAAPEGKWERGGAPARAPPAPAAPAADGGEEAGWERAGPKRKEAPREESKPGAWRPSFARGGAPPADAPPRRSEAPPRRSDAPRGGNADSDNWRN